MVLSWSSFFYSLALQRISISNNAEAKKSEAVKVFCRIAVLKTLEIHIITPAVEPAF